MELRVNFMPQLFYPQGKSPWFLLDRRLGAPQGLCECGGKEERTPSLHYS